MAIIRIYGWKSEHEAFFSKEAEKLAEKGFEVFVKYDGEKGYIELKNADPKKVSEIVGREVVVFDERMAMALELIDSALARFRIGMEKGLSKHSCREGYNLLKFAKRLLMNEEGIYEKVKAFMEATKENEWLKRVEISLVEIYDENELIDLLVGGCWTIGTGFIYKDFCFIEQCNCCNEYAVFKYSNGKAFQFESISADWMGKEKLKKFLKRIQKASDEQLKKLEY